MIQSYWDMVCTPASLAPVIDIGCVSLRVDFVGKHLTIFVLIQYLCSDEASRTLNISKELSFSNRTKMVSKIDTQMQEMAEGELR